MPMTHEGTLTSRTEINDMVLHIPQINMNGTGVSSLQEELQDAHAAVTKAIAAVSRITIHGRDWQTVSNPDEFMFARTEQRDRLMDLEEVKAELLAIHNAIDDQGRV